MLDFLDRHLPKIIGTVVVVLVAFILTASVMVTKGESACLYYGYPEAKVYTSVTYCIKRVNQTDVVVRLDSLERGR